MTEERRPDAMWCERCQRWHRDGDPVERVSSPDVIAVKCMRHAVWANRVVIADLMRMIRREGR